MSGKSPAFQFYPNDHFRDTRVLTPEARGIWMDVLCVLWWTKPGVRKKTLPTADWERLLSVSSSEFERAISDFERHDICDVSRDSHGDVTLMSRRMIRDDKKRAEDAKRKKKQRNKDDVAGIDHEDVTDLSRRSSSSSSSSVTKVTLSSDGDSVHQILVSEPALAAMTYEQDLAARRAAGFAIKNPALMELAETAITEAMLMGDLDHPAAWWRRFLERSRAGSSPESEKKIPPPRHVADIPEHLKP